MEFTFQVPGEQYRSQWCCRFPSIKRKKELDFGIDTLVWMGFAEV